MKGDRGRKRQAKGQKKAHYSYLRSCADSVAVFPSIARTFGFQTACALSMCVHAWQHGSSKNKVGTTTGGQGADTVISYGERSNL
jgi:hypothetical protein